MIETIFKIFGSLGIFLFGMKLLSDSIKKSAGESFQTLLNKMTSNRFKAVFTGLFITSIIQSSSATTVILVSLVNAGLLNLTQAIGVIMGANIGTTFTAWIVSLIGFKFNISYIIYPCFTLGMFLMFSNKEKYRNIGDILLGMGVLFLGLDLLKSSMPDIKNNLAMFEYIKRFSNYGYFSILLFIFIGTIFTIIIQSSSAAMAITLTMAYKGWISFPIAAAFCLGENIGTTITAYLASIGMNSNAKRAARSHTLFNLIGVVWMLIVFFPFLRFLDMIVPGNIDNPADMPVHLSAFHSLFNIINTILLIGFIEYIAKIVEKLVPDDSPKKEEKYELKHINIGYGDFAETNLTIARKEIGKISDMLYNMFLLFLNSLSEKKDEFFDEIENKINYTHNRVLIMYDELIKFLAECRTDNITEKQSVELNSYIVILNELKSISVSGDILIKLIKKINKKKYKLHKNAYEEIKGYTVEILDFLKYNSDFLNEKLLKHNINLALKMEKIINKKRDRFKKQAEEQIAKGGDIQGELLYMDVIKHLEHIGDFNLAISYAMQEIN